MKPYHKSVAGVLYCGDSHTVLSALPDDSVNCICTSPPYFGLRDYQTGRWVGGNPDCEHVASPAATYKQGNPEYARPCREKTKKQGIHLSPCPACGAVREDEQIGMETTVGEYVAACVAVFAECRRVLKPDGTLWLNLGDSYVTPPRDNAGVNYAKSKQATQKGSRQGRPDMRQKTGLPAKNLILVPCRVALALQDDGWILRSDIIWHKRNPMPQSVTDRCTTAHEYIFMLTKSPSYFYDYKKIREAAFPDGRKDTLSKGSPKYNEAEYLQHKTISPGRPHTMHARPHERWPNKDEDGNAVKNRRSVWDIPLAGNSNEHYASFPMTIPLRCIAAGCPEGGTVLDPFAGSGTTLVAALRDSKKYIGIELSEKYCELTAGRIDKEIAQGALGL